jgi:hypothetical protein
MRSPRKPDVRTLLVSQTSGRAGACPKPNSGNGKQVGLEPVRGIVLPACYGPPGVSPFFRSPSPRSTPHSRRRIPPAAHISGTRPASIVHKPGSPPVVGELASNEHSARRRVRYAARQPARVWFATERLDLNVGLPSVAGLDYKRTLCSAASLPRGRSTVNDCSNPTNRRNPFCCNVLHTARCKSAL